MVAGRRMIGNVIILKGFFFKHAGDKVNVVMQSVCLGHPIN